MSEQQALVPVLGPSEARRLTNAIKRDAEALWHRLIGLYEAGAHTALNYPNWHEYCSEEFGFGRSHSYRLLDAGRVAKTIPPLGERKPGPRASIERTTEGTDPSLLINERQARELAPLLRAEDEDAVIEVFSELKAKFGERLTACDVRAAVEKKLKPRPLAIATARPEVDRIARAGEILSRAYDNAARLVAEWLGDNPDEDLERACRRIAPNSWQALAVRVRRRQAART